MRYKLCGFLVNVRPYGMRKFVRNIPHCVRALSNRPSWVRNHGRPLLYCFGYLAILVGSCWVWGWNSQVAQTTALLLTGLVVIWYTWETSRLRLETCRQTEIQLRPFVVLEPVESAQHVRGFKATNIGLGPALNVILPDVKILPLKWESPIVIRFSPAAPVSVPGVSRDVRAIPVLLPRESQDVRAESFVDEISQGDFFVGNLYPQYTNCTLTLEVSFESLDGRKYSTRAQTIPGQFRILKFE